MIDQDKKMNKKVWCYRQGSFEQVEVDYPETGGEDPEKDFRRMGFSAPAHIGTSNSTLHFEWYEHEFGSDLDKNIPYRFLMIVSSTFYWYEIFIPDLPDLLNFLKEYQAIIPMILASDKAIETEEKELRQ